MEQESKCLIVLTWALSQIKNLLISQIQTPVPSNGGRWYEYLMLAHMAGNKKTYSPAFRVSTNTDNIALNTIDIGQDSKQLGEVLEPNVSFYIHQYKYCPLPKGLLVVTL